MAKWGEGDPRWLVEERPDATNVNNWHWTEKNASSWSKKRFSELFTGMKIETAIGYCEITEILKCEGDAVAINRRGKLIFFYEWNLEMKWIGVTSTDNAVVEGKVIVLNLTEEQDIKTDVVVSYSEDQSKELFGKIMEHQGQERILELLNVYVSELKEDFAKDMILPSECSSAQMTTKDEILTDQNNILEQKNVNTAEQKVGVGNLQISETFKCTAEEIYQALTVKDFVQIFTQRECVVECCEGGRFELFEGNVHGYFLTLQPFHTIMMEWRVSSWPENHFSEVMINIVQKMDCTEVKLSQFGVPIQEIENTKEGWKRYYWDNIKKTLGFGAFLF